MLFIEAGPLRGDSLDLVICDSLQHPIPLCVSPGWAFWLYLVRPYPQNPITQNINLDMYIFKIPLFDNLSMRTWVYPSICGISRAKPQHNSGTRKSHQGTCRENSSQEHLRHRYTPFPWTIVGLVHQNALQASPTHRCQICRRKDSALPAHNKIILIYHYLKLMMRFSRWRNKTIFIFVWTNLVSDQYMYEICKGNLHCTRYTNINNDYRY